MIDYLIEKDVIQDLIQQGFYLVYDLRRWLKENTYFVDAIHDTHDKPNVGFDNKYGLFNSKEWWNNVSEGMFQTYWQKGKILGTDIIGMDQVHWGAEVLLDNGETTYHTVDYDAYHEHMTWDDFLQEGSELYTLNLVIDLKDKTKPCLELGRDGVMVLNFLKFIKPSSLTSTP